MIGLAQPLESSAFVQGLQEEAKNCSVWVSVGVHEAPSIPTSTSSSAFLSSPDATSLEKDSKDSDKRCYNTQCLIDPSGRIADVYRKLHLFDVEIKGGMSMSESNTTRKGTVLPNVTETAIGKRMCTNTMPNCKESSSDTCIN